MASSSGLAGLAMLLTAVLCLQLPAASRAQLQVGFYDTTCPNAESIVQQAVADAFATNSGVAAGLIRLHFHDCFVNGCDASVLLSVNPAGGDPERDAPPNNPSLRGFEVVDAARAALEQSCPSTVSCADILAFAARDSINLTGSDVFYQVPSGRRDGSVSNGTLAFTLPGPNLTAEELVKGFADRNMSAEEMVVLSGTHTLGRSHCSSFIVRNRERLASGTISPAYQALLETLCPANTNQTTNVTTEIDLSTPTVLDNNYYKLLPLNLGLHFSDDQLIRNATLKASVDAFAANETLWKEKLVAAMIKMGEIQPKTGAEGEIRLNCSIVNTASSSSSSSARLIEVLRPGSDNEVASS
ncbi:peroxidase 1-like [Lolium rigidum]|uniref:peroxidase 1-like n=1 Tax=Lolium rigidum TaxID=89674 RepID=UPI001F5D3500|nr:peroxidase 1-like [Lolium rigidum]